MWGRDLLRLRGKRGHDLSTTIFVETQTVSVTVVEPGGGNDRSGEGGHTVTTATDSRPIQYESVG